MVIFDMSAQRNCMLIEKNFFGKKNSEFLVRKNIKKLIKTDLNWFELDPFRNLKP
jgi:hypothetical protein